jgi:tol-pal system protein YbgF
MKRADVLFLTIAAALLLAACGGEKEVKKDEGKKEPARVTAAPQKSKTDDQPAQTPAPTTYARPANLKTLPPDTTAVKPVTVTPKQTPVPTSPAKTTAPVVDDTTVAISSPTVASKSDLKEELQDKQSAVTPVVSEAAVQKDSATVTPPEAPIPTKTEVAASTLGSLLFDDIFFDANETGTPSLTFNSNYLITLSKVVKVLKADPDINVRLVGHTMKVGSVDKDVEISLRRAVTVGKLILDLFPASEKESIASRIQIVPAGSGALLIEGDNRVREMLNRRVSIELFEGDLTGSTLADYIYRAKETKPAAISTVPKMVAKPVAKPTPPAPQKASANTTTQDVIYNDGQKLYNQKKYDEAISVFEELIGLDPQHSLADNAQWWIGEIYYSQGNYVDALNAYQKVFDLGDRNKAAYAQLRMGYCYSRLNQKDMAVGAWEKVIREFPKATEEVSKARKALQIVGE